MASFARFASFLVCVLSGASVGASATSLRATSLHAVADPTVATKMAGLEGEACSPDEHKRYQAIVCKMMDVCECTEAKCTLEWCHNYVHEWKKDFGACIFKGCPE